MTGPIARPATASVTKGDIEMDLETNARLLEIPKLHEIERAELDRIGDEIERLEAERKSRLAVVMELKKEENTLLRGLAK